MVSLHMKSAGIAMVAENKLELRTLFAGWLRRRREAGDLSPEALSEQLGSESSPDAVLAWEMGSARPSRRMAERLARFFDISHNEHAAFVLFAISDLDSPDDQAPADIGAGLAFDPDAPWRVQPQSPSNLPKPLTTFVGREADVEQVAAFLSKPGIRLLTLLGPPGIGKTRLSIEAARRLLSSGDYEDGVFFVPLAALTDGSGLAQAVASTLGVKEAAGRLPAEVLADYLRDKRLLLVLDNLEQINDVGPPLADLLTAAPQVQVIGTSRTALHVYGEQVWRVPALPVPPISAQTTADTLSQSEAADLFVQRARSVYPEFIVDDATAPVIAEICRKLDGLPLAIELAAARVNVLKPHALLARLDSRLGVLTGGSQNLPPRQRTLRGAIDWSYNLLDEAEKTAYRRLSVFVGGLTLEAAEQVINAGGHYELSSLDTLDLVSSLLDKSLLRQEDASDGLARYIMLETIREYGLERLQESDEESEVRRVHAQAMLSLVEEAEPHMTTGGRDPWLCKLDADLDNIRAALSWSLEGGGDVEVGLRLAGGLGWYWYFRGHFTEGRKWSELVIGKLDLPHLTEAYAKLLQSETWLASRQGDLEQALEMGEQAVFYWRQTNHDRELATALAMLGITKVVDGQLQDGYALIEQGSKLLRRYDGSWHLAFAIDQLAQASTWLGNFNDAEALWEESYAIYSKIGDKRGVADTLSSLGGVALRKNNLALATERFEKALSIQIALNNKEDMAYLFYGLVDIAFLRNDLEGAGVHCETALALFRELGLKRGISGTLRRLGYLYMNRGDLEGVKTLYTEYLALIEHVENNAYKVRFIASIGALSTSLADSERAIRLFSFVEAQKIELDPAERSFCDAKLAEARQELESSKHKMAWSQGQRLTFPQAMDEARLVLRLPAAITPVVDLKLLHGNTALAKAQLSRREIELLRLVAVGLSNAEIAGRLFLSANTVRAHLYSIYSKIDVSSRTAAAHFANQHKLL
jgi:predicted ATPase/DNA-binding CsgD family transcriptional regulator/transcriptional regulator with XRE-family HTH domain